MCTRRLLLPVQEIQEKLIRKFTVPHGYLILFSIIVTGDHTQFCEKNVFTDHLIHVLTNK